MFQLYFRSRASEGHIQVDQINVGETLNQPPLFDNLTIKEVFAKNGLVRCENASGKKVSLQSRRVT